MSSSEIEKSNILIQSFNPFYSQLRLNIKHFNRKTISSDFLDFSTFSSGLHFQHMEFPPQSTLNRCKNNDTTKREYNMRIKVPNNNKEPNRWSLCVFPNNCCTSETIIDLPLAIELSDEFLECHRRFEFIPRFPIQSQFPQLFEFHQKIGQEIESDDIHMDCQHLQLW